jgi:CTP synthase
VVELPHHPWFLATQFHPELKSRPTHPHPLFASFIGAAIQRRDGGAAVARSDGALAEVAS